MHRRIRLKLFKATQTTHCAPATAPRLAEGKGMDWEKAEALTEEQV